MNTTAGKLGILALVLWGLTVTTVAWFVIRGNATTGEDGRTVVSLTENDRTLILMEMRSLLTGVQGIIKGVSLQDQEMIRKAARSNGTDMAQDINPSLMTKLPMDFKKRGMGLHKEFDQLADASGQMKDQEVLQELARIMDSCIACHSSYKLVTK